MISLVLLGILVLVLVLGLQTGSSDISWNEILGILAGAENSNRLIVIDLRLSRVLLALCTGAVLTLSGFFMQVLIRNPLADPYIMGVTAGAGLGVNLLILGLIPIGVYSMFTLPLFAGLGAALSLFLVMLMGFRAFYEDNSRLLIAGVAVSAMFTAATGLLIYTQAQDDQIRQMVFWSFGSLDKGNWESVRVCSIVLLVGWSSGILLHRRLDVLGLGDIEAQSLGMNVIRMKIGLLILASLIVGATVAFTGPIGFVGMMIPHFSRSFFGGLHLKNIVFGTLLGGIYLALCDLLGRWILPPAGLPIGIVTAILGVPFFLYLLFKKQSYL
ncbi:MAG: iron ABC transporter permease [Bacteroidia bacterium]|nr:iron ABC transporter permease [Bacteroidia bacterium]